MVSLFYFIVYYWTRTDDNVYILANYLDKKMKKQGLIIFDKTLDYSGGQYLSRGEGILEYLSRAHAKNYVILDDLQFDYDGCGLTNNFVKTNNIRDGLTEILADKAIEILNS